VSWPIEALDVFAYTFATVFLAELGDKTQLAILSLSLRGRRAPVLLGAFLAFSLVNGVSSAIGHLFHVLFPLRAIRLGSATAFIIVGLVGLAMTLLRREGADDTGPEEAAEGLSKTTFMKSFALICLAELGDKTQLATLGFSALTGLSLVVAISAVSALMAMTVLTVLLGAELAKRLHERSAEVLAYAVFVVVGVFMLAWPGE